MTNKKNLPWDHKPNWYCPECNNGDTNALIAQELSSFRSKIEAISGVDLNTGVIAIDRRCVKCSRRWTFKTNGTAVINEPLRKVKE